MITKDEYIKHAVQYNCGYVLGQYQKMLLQWFGDDFLIKAPDNIHNFFDQVMQNAKISKDALQTEKKLQEQEVKDAGKDDSPSGGVPQGQGQSES